MNEMKIQCQIYSRITGYMRPLNSWNNGKKQEFSERATFETKI